MSDLIVLRPPWPPLFMLGALNMLDVVFTAAVLGAGGAEANPLARMLLGVGGTGLVGVAKLAVWAAIVCLCVARPPSARLLWAMWAVVGLYVAVVANNTIVLAGT